MSFYFSSIRNTFIKTLPNFIIIPIIIYRPLIEFTTCINTYFSVVAINRTTKFNGAIISKIGYISICNFIYKTSIIIICVAIIAGIYITRIVYISFSSGSVYINNSTDSYIIFIYIISYINIRI